MKQEILTQHPTGSVCGGEGDSELIQLTRDWINANCGAAVSAADAIFC